MFDIGPEAFRPRPSVRSSVVRMDLLSAPRAAIEDRVGAGEDGGQVATEQDRPPRQGQPAPRSLEQPSPQGGFEGLGGQQRPQPRVGVGLRAGRGGDDLPLAAAARQAIEGRRGRRHQSHRSHTAMITSL